MRLGLEAPRNSLEGGEDLGQAKALSSSLVEDGHFEIPVSYFHVICAT